MDEHNTAIIGIRINRTIEHLQKNNMEAYFANNCEEARALIRKLCPAGQTVSNGGSMTLVEAGVMELLRSGDYQFLDREAPDADAAAIYHDAFHCDTYFMSSNAITEAGELYNVDGTGNRIAALIYGPQSVIVLAGYNKIVKDISAANQRLCEMAAPANAHRLSKDTPCSKIGSCCDCHSPDRICCQYLVSRFQRVAGRIKVILVGEPLGY